MADTNQVDALDQLVLAETRREHQSLGWSVRQTAQSFTRHGWPVSTTGVQRILDGTRRSLSVGEWLHASYALAMPPIVLVAPTGRGPFRVGRDRRVSSAALESWIVGASPLPRMSDGAPADAAARITRYRDAARNRSRPAAKFSDHLRRQADAFDRANNTEREGIVLDLLQHMAGVGLQQFGRPSRQGSSTDQEG